MRRALAISLVLAAWLPAGTALADAGGSATVVALKGGVPDRGLAAAGLLLSRSCPSGRCGVYPRCSGVLGPGDRFFTAGHCLTDRARDYWVFLPAAGIIPAAASSVQHFCDDRDDCDAATHDLASLRLARPVADLPVPRLGSDTTGSVRIFGFGDSGPFTPDHGILRSARVTTVPCETGLICYRFSADSPAACNHDSGGPMLRDGRVLGLARRSADGCARGLGSYADLTEPTLAAWWHGPADPPADAVPTVDQHLAFDCIQPACWRMRSGAIAEQSIQVHARAQRLVVTLNHAYLADQSDCRGGLRRCAVDYDLALTGPDGHTGPAGCTCRNDLYQVAACVCEMPTAGRWQVGIDAVGERGPFQITGRVIYRPTPDGGGAARQISWPKALPVSR
jgi:hypothetical protein